MIAQEAMVAQVLEEPGACGIYSLMPLQPCLLVATPIGTAWAAWVDGFAGPGPAHLSVFHLTYDWSQSTVSHRVMPEFALIERPD